MFLDAYGAPKEVTPENLHEYPFDLHGIMLLTSAEHKVFIPPRWQGTIYSTEDLLHNYRKRFNPDPYLFTFHALTPYEPELICCERVAVEITVLPAGQSIFKNSEIVVYLVKSSDINTLITKELGTELNLFPLNHPYHARIMEEGIDIVYVDDKIYNGGSSVGSGGNGQLFSYQHQRVYNLLNKLKPISVKSLSGKQLPEVLFSLCRKIGTTNNNNNNNKLTNSAGGNKVMP
ncbi:uncharacterized protein LOC115631814 [Scaptodrosophila lebanonensis]|uniref:Uncharacterized protein LOC115631814 n=1 Tax=Drosophila lebanonensis TaxID=7225 RepID=A0A6J2U942_DROLE|nr:uncharacterized protein LOC115631814 [Scaptodrosophila lebanonensis]